MTKKTGKILFQKMADANHRYQMAALCSKLLS